MLPSSLAVLLLLLQLTAPAARWGQLHRSTRVQICGAAGALSKVLMAFRSSSYDGRTKQAVCKLVTFGRQQLILMSCCSKTQTEPRFV